MSKVHIDILPSLGEALGMEASSDEIFSADQEGGSGYSVRDLLNRLCGRYRRFDQIVFDVHAQKLTGQVVIFVNGRNFELMEGLETKLKDGDTVTFIPFIEGG